MAAVMLVGMLLESGQAWSEAELSYNSLDYDVKVLANGDMRITEHFDVRLKKKKSGPWRQLNQQFKLSDEQLSEITDVCVKDVTNNREYRKGKVVDRYKDGDDPNWDNDFAGTWSASINSADGLGDQPYEPASLRDDDRAVDSQPASVNGRKVEIAWNIPMTEKASSLKFDVSMTLHDVVRAGDDVAYLKWEPVGSMNSVPIKRLSANIELPQGASNTGENRTCHWLHYDGRGKVYDTGNRSFRFEANGVTRDDYVDVVTIFNRAAMDTVKHQISGNHRREVIDDERVQREDHDKSSSEQLRTALFSNVLVLLVMLVMGVVSVAITNRKSSHKRDIEYFRDVPGVSPASAAMLHCVAEGDDYALNGNIQSRQNASAATVLSLVNKHFIALYPGKAAWYDGLDLTHPDNAEILHRSRDGAARDMKSSATQTTVETVNDSELEESFDNVEGRTTTTIVMLPKTDAYLAAPTGELYDSEFQMLRFLSGAANFVGSRTFDLSSLDTKAEKEQWNDGTSLYKTYDDTAETEFKKGNFAKSYMRLFNVQSWMTAVCVVVYLFLLIQLYSMAPVLSALLGGVAAFVITLPFMLFRSSALTVTGDQMNDELEGLMRYINDFSDFSDRTAFDVKLWGYYLVYAVALGMSEKVVKRLAQTWSTPLLGDARYGSTSGDDAFASALYWAYCAPYNLYGGEGADMDFGASALNDFSVADIGSQLGSELSSIGVWSASSSGTDSGSDSDSSGSFSGSDGGSGGGSFGGW